MNRSSFLLLFSAIFLTPGCDKLPIPILQENWLVGTWVLDREKTVAAFSANNQRETPVGGIAGELAASAILAGVDAMIKPMENIQYVFTENEVTEKAAGLERPRSYQIVDRPDSKSIKILDSNDNVWVYHREAEWIWYHFAGKKKLQIYLKPVGR